MSVRLELRAEADRTVPAIAKLRNSGATKDAETLLVGYLNDAVERGVSPCTAWSIYATAAAAWVSSLVEMVAVCTDRPSTDIIDAMVAEVAGG